MVGMNAAKINTILLVCAALACDRPPENIPISTMTPVEVSTVHAALRDIEDRILPKLGANEGLSESFAQLLSAVESGDVAEIADASESVRAKLPRLSGPQRSQIAAIERVLDHIAQLAQPKPPVADPRPES